MKTSKKVKKLWRRFASWRMSLKDFVRETQWAWPTVDLAEHETEACNEWLGRKFP